MISSYFNKIIGIVERVKNEQIQKLEMAAKHVSKCLERNGVIHFFGAGHSHILCEEVYYRAGGLVPVHPIFEESLMLHKGAVRSSELERLNGYAERFMKEQDIRSGEVVFVISTSGRNGVPIDVALTAKEKGAYVIGITSLAYSSSQNSRHVSGKRLFEVVDLVIDNFSPKGDALLTLDTVEEPFAPSSTVIGAAILNAILARSIEIMVEDGFKPPVFLSGNIEGADEHNKRLIKLYKDRVKL